jgi:hypothetical protein
MGGILMTDDKKDLWESIETLRKAFKEADSIYEKLADECDHDTKIAVVKWAMKHIVEHAQDGGSFRYLIYDRLGFGPEAYAALCSDGMTISNEFDLSMKPELAKALKINNISKAKEVLHLCDEPGCFDEISSGWPAKNGRYRRTCGNHYHEITKLCDSEDGDKMCNDCNCWKHTRSMCG